MGWFLNVLLGGWIVGCKLGILGMGWIGQVVVCCVKVFGMEVYYYNCCCLYFVIEEEYGVIYWESFD